MKKLKIVLFVIWILLIILINSNKVFAINNYKTDEEIEGLREKYKNVIEMTDKINPPQITTIPSPIPLPKKSKNSTSFFSSELFERMFVAGAVAFLLGLAQVIVKKDTEKRNKN